MSAVVVPIDIEALGRLTEGLSPTGLLAYIGVAYRASRGFVQHGDDA